MGSVKLNIKDCPEREQPESYGISWLLSLSEELCRASSGPGEQISLSQPIPISLAISPIKSVFMGVCGCPMASDESPVSPPVKLR